MSSEAPSYFQSLSEESDMLERVPNVFFGLWWGGLALLSSHLSQCRRNESYYTFHVHYSFNTLAVPSGKMVK